MSDPAVRLLLVAAVALIDPDDRILIAQRPADKQLGGLWEFPGGRVEADESPEQASVREFMEETGFAVRVVKRHGIIRHGYTTYRLTLHCFGLEFEGPSITAPPPLPPHLTAATECRWVNPQELNELAMPAAHRKLADKLFAGPDAHAAQQTTLPASDQE